MAERPNDGLLGLTPAQVSRPNLKDAVAATLRERIFSGELKPGAKIDQNEAADRLGVSKLPVREALIALEAEALVENVPRRGTFVASLSRSDVRDHYQIYGMVAGLAAERSASALGEPDLDAIETLMLQLEQAPRPEDQERLNFAFHRLINLGGGRRLRSVLRNLSKGIPTNFYVLNPGWAEIAKDHHRSIFEAIRDHDTEGARGAMEHHLVECADYAVRVLEAGGFWQPSDDAAERDGTNS